MSEKKQVLYDLRTAYSGPFAAEDFYAEVDRWIDEKGFEKEHKKKLEHVTKSGKKIEWVIEAQRHLDDLHTCVIVLRALLDNVKETVIKRGKKKTRINNGDIFISIDGFIISDVHGSFYQVKPAYYFLRALVDKFVYNFWSGRHDGAAVSAGQDLFKRISSFFSLQKYKYE